MAWEEWEQIKAEAAQQQPTRMQLNQLPGNVGGDTSPGDLVVHDDELGKLGNMAYDLLSQVSTDADMARPSTFTASNALFNDGLDMGSALLEVHDGWNTQLGTLKEACAHISNHLDFTRARHAEDESYVETGMHNAAGDLMTPSRINDYFH
ncbi:hypothetical protein ACFWGR_06770 [Streptomyces sp. NPDC060311]|uniref:hypothetical protein n=1 Tax=Streptomyces sp. NPDC060311 TaxID=3347096 RepID=UPI003663AC0A